MQVGDRLRHARIKAGYGTAKAFANAHGIPQPTYAMHEKGTRKIDVKTGQRYAEWLSCDAGWLLTGEGPEPDDQLAGILPRTMSIIEADVRASAGAGGLSNRLDGEAEEVDEWQVPRDFIRAQTTAPVDNLRVIRVYGDSMAPDFIPGDRVLVDTSDISPSPSGVFVMFDGLGIVIKRVEFIPYSEPKSVRLLSSNKHYATYERALNEVTINGRVIAKWLWT